MTPNELTITNFDSTLSRPGLILVDCWAPWCGSCKQFGPVFERVARRHPDHTFVKLDTSTQKGLTKDLGIAHVPSLLIFNDGILIFNQPGNFGEEDLEGILTKAQSLDMDRVRKEIDEASAAIGSNDRTAQ